MDAVSLLTNLPPHFFSFSFIAAKILSISFPCLAAWADQYVRISSTMGSSFMISNVDCPLYELDFNPLVNTLEVFIHRDNRKAPFFHDLALIMRRST